METHATTNEAAQWQRRREVAATATQHYGGAQGEERLREGSSEADRVDKEQEEQERYRTQRNGTNDRGDEPEHLGVREDDERQERRQQRSGRGR